MLQYKYLNNKNEDLFKHFQKQHTIVEGNNVFAETEQVEKNTGEDGLIHEIKTVL